MIKSIFRISVLASLLFSLPLVSHQPTETPAIAKTENLLDVETLYQHSEWCDYADGTEYGWSVAIGDVDGDMFDDIVVAADDDNTTYVHYGSVTAVTYWLPSSVPLSGDVTTSDLNDDGRSDVVIGSWGDVRVYYGTQDRTAFGSTQWETEFTVSNPYRTYLAPLGDVSGDGVDDIVVGFPDDNLAYVIYGNDQPGGVPQGPYSINYLVFANARGHAGDVNDDGYPDVLRTTPGSGSVQPSVSLHLGTTTQMNDPNRVAATPAWTVSGIADTTSSMFGDRVGSAGDLNADGYGDIVITDPFYDGQPGNPGHLGYWGAVFIWLGGPSSPGDPSGLGASETPLTADIIKYGDIANGSTRTFAAGDINADNYGDFAIGDWRGADYCFDPDTGQQVCCVETGLVKVYRSGYVPPDIDVDSDGIIDANDNCPRTSNPTQTNSDGDSLGDACDNCDFVDNESQDDGDLDEIGDACDACEDDPLNDEDGDTICDGDGYASPMTGDNDNCPQTPNTNQSNIDNDDDGDVCDACPDDWHNDGDGDTICEGDGYASPMTGDNDNCPLIGNTNQNNIDGDDYGDICDNCVYVVNNDQLDGDGDTRGDACDNCPTVYNWDQANDDDDDLGNACDPDDDNDGILDYPDNCDIIPNGPDLGTCTDGYWNILGDPCTSDSFCGLFGYCDQDQDDTDGDGVGDACNDSSDSDGDEWSDALDNCPDTYNPSQYDSNGDGIGTACATDLTVQGVELTQAVQYYRNGYISNSIPLIYGRDTVIRVYLDVGEANRKIEEVTGYYRFTNSTGQQIATYGPIWPNGQDPRGVLEPGPQTITAFPPGIIDRNLYTHTLNFFIDSDWYWFEPVYITIDVSSPNDVNPYNNSYTYGPLVFYGTDMNVMFVRINPQGNCSTPNSNHFFEDARYVKKIYPISHMDVYQHNTIITACLDPTGWDGVKGFTLLTQLWWLNLFTDDPLPDMKYYGMVCSELRPCQSNGGPLDCSVSGMGNGDESWGIRTGKQLATTLGGETMAHELGHTYLGTTGELYEFWPGHVKDECGAHGPFFPDYPNPYGLIDTAGFDVATNEIIPFTTSRNDDSYYDIMTYAPCAGSPGQGRWISGYIYNKLFQRLHPSSSQAASAVPLSLQATEEYLGVTGTIGEGDVVESLEMRRVQLPEGTSEEQGTGSYSLELRDGTGGVLFTRLFNLQVADGVGEELGFSQVLPYQPGTASIVLMHNISELETVSVSDNAPQVTVTYPDGGEMLIGVVTVTWTASDLDGDTLYYDVLYSKDGGTSWSALAVGWDEDSLQWDTNASPGTTNGLIKVIANDGVNNGQDVSDASFTIPGKPPQVAILAPSDGSVVFREEMVVFEGEAYDVEDGPLDGDALDWTSSIDGSIGTGNDLALNGLSHGTHAITLTVEDNDANIAQAFLSLLVRGTRDTDGDGVGNNVDNCDQVSNPDQADTDGDGIGDACEGDDADGDGYPDFSDNCPDVANDQKDSDFDGLGDACDLVDDSVRIYLPVIMRNSYTLSIILGHTNLRSGLTLHYGGDVDTEVILVGSPQMETRRTGNGSIVPAYDGNQIPDYYMQFDVDDSFLYEADSSTRVQIEVMYHDYGTDRFLIEYDGHTGGPFGDGRFKTTTPVYKTGTGEFKIAVFELDEVYFGNRDNGGDFRIADDSDGAESIRKVAVRLLP